MHLLPTVSARFRPLLDLSRRSGLPEHEAEEFRSWALFKLVENDSRVLARWEGRSSFSTYLNVALSNLLRDYRIQVWGKWRPSAQARRGGSMAVLLERLWIRDGLSLDERQADAPRSRGQPTRTHVAGDLPASRPSRGPQVAPGSVLITRTPGVAVDTSRVRRSPAARSRNSRRPATSSGPSP